MDRDVPGTLPSIVTVSNKISSTPFHVLLYMKCKNYAAVAVGLTCCEPLPVMAGARLVEARRASRMNLGVRMSLRCSE